MLNKYRVLAGAVAIALALTSGGRLAAQIQPDDEGNQLWFVELQTSAATFRARAASSSIVYTERFAFNRLWNGLSVVASEAEAGRIGRVAGVRAVFPVLTFGLDPVPDDKLEPEMKSALAMTGASAAQAGPDGATGEGIKVAVIDTGVDYDHPDLGGGFGAGFHVAHGYDFVGDRYDAGTAGGRYQIPHPDADPDDCNGHGTHVAGIIGATGDAAAGGVLGVAPGVTLGAYRVFGCDGSTSADIMLAAMERAHSDGMQVVNMSIGSAFQNWPQYPTAVAADALVAKGVVVVASIGNSGANGVYSAGAPGVGRDVIGVASYDNTFIEQPYFQTNDETKFGFDRASGGAAIPTTGSAPIVRTGTPASAADACNTGTPPAPPALGDLTGKIALIRRGTCGFYEKSINAQNAGAIGVVLYNNAFGLLTPNVQPPVAGAPEVQIPVVMLTDAAGVALNNRIAAGAVTLTWTNKLDFFPNPTAGRASGFSSYGLDAELQLKPNIGAPGGRIRSTFPLEVQKYAVLSGTSMSSPHVAGAVALYLEKHPTATPAQVKTALQNSADPVNFFSGAANSGVIDAVHKQGAGMLDIDDAILATTSITPSEISVGEGTAAKSFELTITNGSETAVTYSITHQGAVATAGTFQVGLFNNPATFSTLTPNFTLLPGGSQVVSVTITPPAGGNLHVYGGYIRIAGDRTYRVPYAGLRGNYQAIQVLAPGGCAAVPFPAIFRQGGETICTAATPTAAAIKLDVAYTPQASGATFNVEERSDRPVIFYHRAHQSRRLEIRAINQSTNETYLLAAQDYVSRNAANGTTASTGSFSSYRWDGKYVATTGNRVNRREAPVGTYTLQIVATKASERGDSTTPETETWTSAPLHITRTSTSRP
jgi:minor extracellular serine protease Vpr